MKDQAEHYLKVELDARLNADSEIWRFIQLGSLDGIWYWNLENPADEWMSPEFWRLFGIDPATRKHSPDEWQDIIFPEDLKTATDSFHAHCADPDQPYDQLVRYRHANGSTVWVRCRGLAIRDETGRPIRMLGAHNDMTAAKRAEQRAIEATAVAEAANAEVRTFAYSISHDLKAPVNTLDLLLNEMRHDLGPALKGDAARFMDMSQDTLDRMKVMVESVMNYTQLADMQPEMQDAKLDELLQYSLKNLAADITRADAIIEIGDLPMISCNPDQIMALFQNLIANALKFTQEGRQPRISVYCEQHLNFIEIKVEDNGIGIAQEHLKRIFTLFQRLHSTDEYSGSGLGLALCQKIALNHGGEITVSSVQGEGTCFTVKLARTAV